MIPKNFTNIQQNDFKHSIYNNYKSFFKNYLSKGKETLKNEKRTKSYISLKNDKIKNSSYNTLMKITSENNANDYNKDLIGKFNIFGYNKEKYRKKFLSQNNLNLKKDNNKNDSVFLNKNNSKDNIFNFSPINNFLNLKNISNLNNSISLLNDNLNNIGTLYNNNKNVYTTLRKKGNKEKNFLNSQSNLNKIEYIKRMIRKYYFENFDNLKDYYNFININGSDYLTIHHFVRLLKNIIKIDIHKKEIIYLLDINGIIKVDYLNFKHIFFPEQKNNKLLNLKLKNEKNDSLSENKIKINNNNSYIKTIRLKNKLKEKFSIISKKIIY